MSRRFPDRPVVGVGAVIVGPKGVVLVRRGQPPLLGEWSLPGGGVEIGETVTAALTREVREETGLEVQVGPLLGVFDRIHRAMDQRIEYHYVLIDFLCTAVGGALQPASDAADARWVAPDDLPSYALDAAALAVIGSAFKLPVAASAATPDTPALPTTR